MGPITRELLQRGLIDYLTIMALFEPGKEERGAAVRGAAVIEPGEIANQFSREEYMRLYKANAPGLVRLMNSSDAERRGLAYAIHRNHLRVQREYAQREIDAV